MNSLIVSCALSFLEIGWSIIVTSIVVVHNILLNKSPTKYNKPNQELDDVKPDEPDEPDEHRDV